MTTFPNSPRLFKGALITLAPPAPTPQIIAFQYNPDTMTRSLQAQGSSDGGERSEATRLKGAPVETIKVDIEIDATDELERAEPPAVTVGIYPQLSALELLLYPSSAIVAANTALLATGTIEIVPPDGPMTLLVWGVNRVVPVKLTEFSIVEEAYDIHLNPIRAKVSLGLRVLSYSDLSLTHPGYHLFLGHQMVKETMARLATSGGVQLPATILNAVRQ